MSSKIEIITNFDYSQEEKEREREKNKGDYKPNKDWHFKIFIFLEHQ